MTEHESSIPQELTVTGAFMQHAAELVGDSDIFPDASEVVFIGSKDMVIAMADKDHTFLRGAEFRYDEGTQSFHLHDTKLVSDAFQDGMLKENAWNPFSIQK